MSERLDGVDLVVRNARVRIRSMAFGHEHHTMAEGRVVAYSARPQICVRADDGTQSWWVLDAAEEIDG